jgi:type II secretory pathway component PulJ
VIALSVSVLLLSFIFLMSSIENYRWMKTVEQRMRVLTKWLEVMQRELDRK